MQTPQQLLNKSDYAVIGYMSTWATITALSALVELQVKDLLDSIDRLRAAGHEIYQKTFIPQDSQLLNPVTVYSLCDFKQPNDACIEHIEELKILHLNTGLRHE